MGLPGPRLAFAVSALAWTFLGLGLGLLLHPYFPRNVEFAFFHLLPKAVPAEQAAVSVGQEWYPYSLNGFIVRAGPSTTLTLLGLVPIVHQLARRRWPDWRTLVLGILALGFLAMVARSQRLIEYYPAFAVMFCAWSWSHAPATIAALAGLARFSLSDRMFQMVGRFLPVMPWLAAIVIAPFIVTSTLIASREADDGVADWNTYRDGALWLARNTPAGSRVFTTGWDDFPHMFFWNTHNTYLVGLDPTYTSIEDPERYQLWRSITQGRVPTPSRAIREHFGAAVHPVRSSPRAVPPGGRRRPRPGTGAPHPNRRDLPRAWWLTAAWWASLAWRGSSWPRSGPTEPPPLPIELRWLAAFLLFVLLPGWLLVVGVLRPARTGAHLETVLLTVAAGYSQAVLLGLAIHAAFQPIEPWQLTTGGGLVVLLLAAAAYRRAPTPQPPPRARGRGLGGGGYLLRAWPLLLIIAVAAPLRLFDLGWSEFQGDEARVVLRAMAALQGADGALAAHRKVPGEILLSYLFAGSLGQIVEQIARLPFALAGVGAVLAFYCLARKLLGDPAALVAGLLLAVNGYFVAFGRILQYDSLAFFLGITGLLCCWRFGQTASDPEATDRAARRLGAPGRPPPLRRGAGCPRRHLPGPTSRAAGVARPGPARPSMAASALLAGSPRLELAGPSRPLGRHFSPLRCRAGIGVGRHRPSRR